MKNHQDHEEARETLWREAFVAVSRSDTALDIKTCVNWADQALAAFDQRFDPAAHEKRAEDRKAQLEKDRAKEAKKKGASK